MSETPEVKPKKKKSSISKEEKMLVQMMKLVFSSITARSCPYAYIFPGSNRFIISNSTAPRAANELKKDLIIDHDLHGDRLMSFSDANVSLHVVEVKDPYFLKHVRDLLGIPEYDVLQQIWCVMTQPFITFVNKYPLRDLEAKAFTKLYNDVYIHLVTKKKQEIDRKNLVAFNIINYHCAQLLFHYLNVIPNIYTTEHSLAHPHIYRPMEVDPVLVGKVYMQNVPFKTFRDQQGNLIFPAVIPSQQIICIDGLTAPSVREFMKKVADQPYTYQQYLWVVDRCRVLSLTYFENDQLKIWTTRPYMYSVAMTDTLNVCNYEALPQPTYT